MNPHQAIELLVNQAIMNSNITLTDKKQLIAIGDELIKGIIIEDEAVQPPTEDVQPAEESE